MEHKRKTKRAALIGIALALLLIVPTIAFAVGGNDGYSRYNGHGYSGIESNSAYYLKEFQARWEVDDTEGSIPLEIGSETKDVVYIMSTSKESENLDYYLTIAIEYSRQADYSHDTSKKSDYKGGINNRESIVIPTCYMQVLRKDNPDWEPHYLNYSYGNYVKCTQWAYVKDGVNSLETVFWITVDDLVNAIKKDNPEWAKEIQKARDDGTDYYIKANKIITRHDNQKGFLCTLKNVNYTGSNHTAPKFVSKGLVVPDSTEEYHVFTLNDYGGDSSHCLDYFNNVLFPGTSTKTQNGLINSRHQSVPIVESGYIVFYDIDAIKDPKETGNDINKAIIWSGSISDYTNAGEVEYGTSISLKFKDDKIKASNGKTYTLATETEYAKTPPMQFSSKTSFNTSVPASNYRTTMATSSSTSWLKVERKDLYYNVKWDSSNKPQKTICYFIPVKAEPGDSEFVVKFVDVDSGDVLSARITGKSGHSTVFDKDKREYGRDNLILEVGDKKYNILTDKDDWGKYPPTYFSKVTNKSDWSGKYSNLKYTSFEGNVKTSGEGANWTMPSGKKADTVAWLVIPVREKGNDTVTVRYVDVTDGKEVVPDSKTEDSFDPKKEYVHTEKSATIEGTKSGGEKAKYVIANEPDWGDYAAYFMWDTTGKVDTSKLTYKKMFDKFNPDTVFGPTSANSMFSYSVSKSKATISYKLKANTAKGKVTLWVPVYEQPQIQIVFYDVKDSGNTNVLVTKPEEYDPAKAYKYSIPNTEIDKLIIKDAEGNKYRIVDETKKESAIPALFAWSGDNAKTASKIWSYTRKDAASAKKVPNSASPNKRQYSKDAGTASWTINANTMSGRAVLYIPVEKVADSVVINYIDDKTGTIVWAENSTYDTEKGTHKISLQIEQEHDGLGFTIIKSSKATHPAKYTYADIADWQKVDYDIAMESAAKGGPDTPTAISPSTESLKTTKGIATYESNEGVLEGYVTLYVPVKLKETVVTLYRYYKYTRYYTNQLDEKGEPVSSGSWDEMYEVVKDVYEKTSEYTSYDASPITCIDKRCPEPGDLNGIYAYVQKYITPYTSCPDGAWTEEAWSSIKYTYQPRFYYGDTAELLGLAYVGGSLRTEDGSAPKTLKKWGRIATKIEVVQENAGGGGTHTAAYYTAPEGCWHEEEGCLYRVVEVSSWDAVFIEKEKPSDILIVKNDIEDDPNTTSDNQGYLGESQDSFAAPNLFTYNYSDEFNIGEAIPTSEKFINGVEVDSWYGHVRLKKQEVNPSARIELTATARYAEYELTYEDVTYSVLKYGPYTTYGTYKDEDGNNVTGWHTVIGYYYGTATKTLATGYRKTGNYKTVTYKNPAISFDLHNDQYKYGFYYVHEINLLQLDSAETKIPFKSSMDLTTGATYPSDIKTPYAFITNPYEGNKEGSSYVKKRYAMIRGNEYTSQFSSEKNKGESGGSVGSRDLKTHVEISSDLTWEEIFNGKTAKRTVPDDNDTRTIDSAYVKAYTDYTTGRTYYRLDTTAENAIKTQCKTLCADASTEYFNETYGNNMDNRLIMHHDTVMLRGETFSTETAGYTGTEDRVSVGKVNNPNYPDVLSTRPSSWSRASEATLMIPTPTYNGVYYSRIEAHYSAFPCGGKTANLVVDDNKDVTRGRAESTDAILDGYKSNEPIVVHSPVIAPVVIKESDKGETQTALESPFAQLKLDGTYKITFEWKNLYKDIVGYAKGYHEDQTEGLTEYVKEKMVRFPFPVILKVNGTEKYIDNSNSGYTEWIHLDEAQWKEFEFYIPTWAKTGLYYDDNLGGTFTGRDDVIHAAIEIRCIANNSVNDGLHGYLPDDSAILDYVPVFEKYESGESKENYVATYKYPVQISGWMYGFTIITTNDQTSNGGDDYEEDNLFNYVKEKRDLIVGPYNRFGTDGVRLINGGDYIANWKNYTLPLTTGKSPYKMMGTVRQGTDFSFELKTILGGERDISVNGGIIPADKIKVEVTPSFRYYSADGTLYEGNSIEVLYPTVDAQYTKIGSAYDTPKNSGLKGTLGDPQFDWAHCMDIHNPICSYSYIADRFKCGAYTNAFAVTAQILTGRQTPQYSDMESIRDKQTQYGSLSKLELPSSTMLYSGDEAELKVNETTNAESALRYNAGLPTINAQKRFSASMQTWYGKYRIPYNLHVRIVKEPDGTRPGTFEEYMNEHGSFEDPSDVFETDGYLVLNFDIKLYVERNGEWQLETSYSNGKLDMWERENGGNPDYTAYSGPWVKLDNGSVVPVNTPVTIDARSGDVLVVSVGDKLGDAPGTDERQVEALWINR